MEQLIREAVQNVTERIENERGWLEELDSEIGDGDFGTNLQRGARACTEELERSDSGTPAELVRTVGQTLLNEVGGSSGVLIGMSLMKASEELSGAVTRTSLVRFAERFRSEIEDRGEVSIGDKTMYDVIVPVVSVLQARAESELSSAEVSAQVVEAARRGAIYTSALQAHSGRASYTELRAVGNPDPGAVGIYLILQEIHKTVQLRTDTTVEPHLGDPFDP
jgi:dihydroxyacetone kinase-like protein